MKQQSNRVQTYENKNQNNFGKPPLPINDKHFNMKINQTNQLNDQYIPHYNNNFIQQDTQNINVVNNIVKNSFRPKYGAFESQGSFSQFERDADDLEQELQKVFKNVNRRNSFQIHSQQNDKQDQINDLQLFEITKSYEQMQPIKHSDKNKSQNSKHIDSPKMNNHNQESYELSNEKEMINIDQHNYPLIQ